MKKGKKIEVSAKLNTLKVWDFGMYPKYLADKTIQVDCKLWDDFIEARTKYELINEELEKLVS